MKKLILLTITLLTIAGTANAQYVLTPQGIKNTVNPDADFFTVDCDQKASAELYNAVLVHIAKLFVSPKDVISKVENEAVTINAIGSIVAKNAAGIKTKGTMLFTMSMQFKDNKVRFNDPNIIRMKADQELCLQGGGYFSACIGIFNKKGEVRNDIAKETIELFFNSLVKNLESGLEDSDNSNW